MVVKNEKDEDHILYSATRRLTMCWTRDILCAERTIQEQYSNVYKALLRYQIHESTLLAKSIDMTIREKIDFPRGELEDTLSMAVEDQLGHEIPGLAGTELVTQISDGVAEDMWHKVVNTSMKRDALAKEEEAERDEDDEVKPEEPLVTDIEQQTTTIVAEVLIIVKSIGCIKTLKPTATEDGKLELDMAFRVLFLDRRTLMKLHNSTNVDIAVNQDPVPAFMPVIYSPNEIINNMRAKTFQEILEAARIDRRSSFAD